jgi:hypothetical protein
MTRFTVEDISSWWPDDYNPAIHLPEKWSGFAIDILRHENIPPEDKLWIVCRKGIIDDKTLRLFAVWCARSIEHLLADDRSRNAINVAERFANGTASQEEITAAVVAASSAVVNRWPPTLVAQLAAMGNALASAMITERMMPRVTWDMQVEKLIEMVEGEK